MEIYNDMSENALKICLISNEVLQNLIENSIKNMWDYIFIYHNMNEIY